MAARLGRHGRARHGGRYGLALACCLLAWLHARAVPAAEPMLFGAQGVRSASLQPFPKWTGMLERHFADKGAAGGDCSERRFNACHQAKWHAFIDGQRGRPLAEQLEAVNTYMNRHRYIVDPINWGVDDYWTTPAEFFSKDGDCEDYAIAKYLTLAALGVPESKLRLVVLQDLNLRVPHAVLAVLTEDGAMILDNQIGKVVPDAAIHHYRPIFAINSEAWWLLRPGKPAGHG